MNLINGLETSEGGDCGFGLNSFSACAIKENGVLWKRLVLKPRDGVLGSYAFGGMQIDRAAAWRA